MTKIVDRVHDDPRQIALLQARIADLADESIVEITLADGSKVRGVVTARPTLQAFRDGQGREGVNALLRLDDLQQPGQAHFLWLDRIDEIFHMGSD